MYTYVTSALGARDMASQSQGNPVLPVVDSQRPQSRSPRRGPVLGPARENAIVDQQQDSASRLRNPPELRHRIDKILLCGPPSCGSKYKIITTCRRGRDCCEQELCGSCGRVLRRKQGPDCDPPEEFLVPS